MRKKLFIKLSVLAVVLLTGLNLSAQKKKDYRDSSTVIVFSQSTKPSSVTSTKRKIAGETNVIKIAPLGFVSGTFPVYYERAITDYFSVQGGLGLTSKNYYRMAGFSANDALNFSDAGSSSSSNGDIADRLYHFDNRTAKIGFMFAVQPRFYFDSEGLEGSFFGIGYSNRGYSFEHQGVTGVNSDGTGIFGGPAKSESENLSDLFAVFGYQVLHDRISFESTFEAGITNVSGSKYVVYTTNNGSGYAIKDPNQFQSYTQSKLYINWGIKVGYHF